jgi:branched-chain amino acid aminotransferase
MLTELKFFITPVSLIRNGDVDISLLGKDPSRPKYSNQIKSWLESIMFGREVHEWAYLIEGEVCN